MGPLAQADTRAVKKSVFVAKRCKVGTSALAKVAEIERVSPASTNEFMGNIAGKYDVCLFPEISRYKDVAAFFSHNEILEKPKLRRQGLD